MGVTPAKTPLYLCFGNAFPKFFFFKFSQTSEVHLRKHPPFGVFGDALPKTPFFRFWGVSEMNFRIMQKLCFFLCFLKYAVSYFLCFWKYELCSLLFLIKGRRHIK